MRDGARVETTAPFEPSLSPLLRYLEVDRLTLWRVAVQMLAAHPLSGVGPGNFRLLLGAYLNQPVSNNLHANNTYLELFADAGLASYFRLRVWLGGN
jgi:O-antigen ligase